MSEDRKLSILDLLLVLSKRAKSFVIIMSLIAVGSVVYTYLVTPYFTAKAVLLPSKAQGMSGLASLLPDAAISGLMKSFNMLESTKNDQFLSILGSRRLGELVIAKFDLAHRYKFAKNRNYIVEDVLRSYSRNLKIDETDHDNIEISFTDKDPKVAAEIVNFIIAEVDSISYQLAKNSAKNSREFFEGRLAALTGELDTVHARMLRFQHLHNIYDIDQQAKATVEALSEIETNILSTDMRISLLGTKFGSQNPELDELKSNKRAMQDQLSRYLDHGTGKLILPLSQTPELEVEYAYLFRDVKVKELLYMFVMQMFEQSRLTEVNNSPVVNVLEFATPPQKKSRPKRMIICLLSFLAGGILLTLYFLSEEWLSVQRRQNTTSYQMLLGLFENLGLKFRKP